MATQEDRYDILIVGGGSAGLTTAARLSKLLKIGKQCSMGILEPSQKHYYQPLWTLVGAGVYPKEVTERSEKDFIPHGATWIREAASEFVPDDNHVVTQSGKKIYYKFLVVATGIQVNWNKIPGLSESVGKNGVCSNYSYDTVQSTWENIKQFKGGVAIFTQPPPPFKCGGAPPENHVSGRQLLSQVWR